MVAKAMEAGKTLESTSDGSSGVEGVECRESLIMELERPSLIVLGCQEGVGAGHSTAAS